MTDMIEKMARAAHRAELALNNETNESVIEIDWEMHGWRYIEGQKAALSALEEPSDSMLQYGLLYQCVHLASGQCNSHEENMRELLKGFAEIITAAKESET